MEWIGNEIKWSVNGKVFDVLDYSSDSRIITQIVNLLNTEFFNLGMLIYSPTNFHSGNSSNFTAAIFDYVRVFTLQDDKSNQQIISWFIIIIPNIFLFIVFIIYSVRLKIKKSKKKQKNENLDIFYQDENIHVYDVYNYDNMNEQDTVDYLTIDGDAIEIY